MTFRLEDSKHHGYTQAQHLGIAKASDDLADAYSDAKRVEEMIVHRRNAAWHRAKAEECDRLAVGEVTP